MSVEGKRIAEQMVEVASYSKDERAKISALLMAYENDGQIIPHTVTVGEACMSMDIRPTPFPALMVGFGGYASERPLGFQLLPLGREVAGALKLLTQTAPAPASQPDTPAK